MSNSPEVILVIGEGSVNDSLAQELALDGYQMLRTAQPQRLRASSPAGEIDLIILGPTCRARQATSHSTRAARGRA